MLTENLQKFLPEIRFNAQGLLPVIAQSATTGEVLMLAWMNAEALEITVKTGEATYWSRSRGALWRKGETSGHTQRVTAAKFDCDYDTLLISVEQTGPACHTGANNCFFREIVLK